MESWLIESAMTSRQEDGSGVRPRRRRRGRRWFLLGCLLLCVGLAGWFILPRLLVESHDMFALVPARSDWVLVQSELSKRWLDWRNGCFVQQLLGMESAADLREEIVEAGPSKLTDWESWTLDLFGSFAVCARIPSEQEGGAPTYILLGRSGLRGERLSTMARAIQHFEDAEFSIESGTYRGIAVNALRWEDLPPEIELRYSIVKGVVIFAAGPGGEEIHEILDRYLDGSAAADENGWLDELERWSDVSRAEARGRPWGLSYYAPKEDSGRTGVRWYESEEGGLDAVFAMPGGPLEGPWPGTPLRFIPAASPLTLVIDRSRLEWMLDAWLYTSDDAPAGLDDWVQTAMDGWVGGGVAVGVGGWKPYFRRAPMEMPMPVLAIPCTDRASATRSLLDITMLINQWKGWSLKMLGHGVDGRLVYRWEELEGGRPAGLLAFPRAVFLDDYLVVAWHPEVMEQVLQLYDRDVATLASRFSVPAGLGAFADFDALGVVVRPLLQLTAMASSFTDDPSLDPIRSLNMADVVPVIEAFRCLGMVEAVGEDGTAGGGDALRVRVGRREGQPAPSMENSGLLALE